MTYSFIKPDAGPSPLDDVDQIRTNFFEFDRVFSMNHTALNDPNQGDHESVILTRQTEDPGVTEDLAVVYCKNASSRAGTQPQLFIQIKKFLPNQNDFTNADNTPMQFTYNSVNTSGPVYQSFLPGGLLLYFGQVTGNTTPNVLIADTVILSPAPTKILLAIAAPNTMTTTTTSIPFLVSTQINSATNDRFVINSNGNSDQASIPYSFRWIAIGTA